MVGDDDKDDHSLCSRRGAPCSLIGAHACPLKTPSLLLLSWDEDDDEDEDEC